MSLSDFRLYLITDRHQTGGRGLLEVVERALDGGVRGVQLREKDLSGAEMYRTAEAMRQLTDRYDARLLINERADVAVAVGADGVQLGIGSLPVSAVRQLLGPDKIIGYSAHSREEAERVQRDGADFVTFGPVYETPSKLRYGAPVGLQRLTETAAALRIPVMALGGISLANVSETFTATIGGVAVISAVLGAADPRGAALTLLKKIEEYAQRP